METTGGKEGFYTHAETYLRVLAILGGEPTGATFTADTRTIYCPSCGGAGCGCPDCESGLISVPDSQAGDEWSRAWEDEEGTSHYMRVRVLPDQTIKIVPY